MTQRICAAAAFAACMTAPALAQDWYGAVDVTLDSFEMDDDGEDEGNSMEFGGHGFAGLTFAEDWYAEGELSFASVFSIDTPVQRGLRDGEVLSARVGKTLGALSLEGILATMSVVSGNNDAPGLPEVERTVIAGAGTYRFDENIVGGLLIGRLEGDEFSDGPSGLDAFDGFNHLAAHVDYRLNDEWSIIGSFAYGTGDMDFDRDTGSVRHLAVEARYAFAKRPIDAYVGLADTRFWQQDPDESADNDEASRVSLFAGVRWTFGDIRDGRGRERMPLPDYLTWIAVSDGTLE